ncbi:hypothetical protein F-VV10_0209 [Faustovirus]|nr:hypothetical protein F-VV10_0209 [Faustovirus]
MYKQLAIIFIIAQLVLSVKLISTQHARIVGCDVNNHAIIALPNCGEITTNIKIINNTCKHWFNSVELIQVIYYADRPCKPLSFNKV